MFKQKPFIFSLFILFILISLHLGASYFSWYWLFPQLDIIVHIFSGLWIASVALWLASIFEQINSLKDYKKKSFLIAVISALLFGVLWELIENFSRITFVDLVGYRLDTALDILSDGLGGVLAYLYFTRSKKCLNKTYEIFFPLNNQIEIIKQ